MTTEEKITALRALLGDSQANYTDDQLTVFLNLARSELLNWYYWGNVPADDMDVSPQHEPIQLYAVIAGLNGQGTENELARTENGISISFAHPDMVDYIRCNTRPLAKMEW